MGTPEEKAMMPEGVWVTPPSEEEKFLATLPSPPLQTPYFTSSEKVAMNETGKNVLKGLFIVFCLLSLPVIFVVGAFATALATCGISGCSGGGFGVAGSPASAVLLSVLTGIAMVVVVAATLMTAKVGKPRTKIMVAILVAFSLVCSLIVSQLVLFVAGADWRGCPASGGEKHCPDGWWDVSSIR